MARVTTSLGLRDASGPGRCWFCGREWQKSSTITVECGEEGVHIDHDESVPFPSGIGIGKPTLICGRPQHSNFAQTTHTKRLMRFHVDGSANGPCTANARW